MKFEKVETGKKIKISAFAKKSSAPPPWAKSSVAPVTVPPWREAVLARLAKQAGPPYKALPYARPVE